MQNTKNHLEGPIRPSQLPKLAACGQFKSAPGTSDAAARGTRIDSIFRSMWETGEIPANADWEEIKVAHWAVGALLKLGNNHATKTAEKDCKVWIRKLARYGTMDAVNREAQWHADLKTGQIYDYQAQMAAYALGCMQSTGTDAWTAYLIFADQEQIVTHEFTIGIAEIIVEKTLRNVGSPPTPNEYCGWCSKALTCAPRVQAQEKALQTTEAGGFLAVLENPERLGEFLRRAKIFDQFREAAKDRAREYLEAGEEVPGWRLQKPRVSESLSIEDQLASGLPLEALITAHGPISAKKARQIGKIDETKVIRKESRPILSEA